MNRQARRDDARLRRLNHLLEQMSGTDELTGLGNRVALHRGLTKIRSRIDRDGERFALLMLDLDHFKGINDLRGHFAGDEVLRRVAAAIDQAKRESDAAYRFGGEEFVAIVSVADADEAVRVAERVRRAVAALGIPHPSNEPFGLVAASIGACVVDRQALAESVESWLQVADEALYEAKRQGRNRSVVSAAPPRPRPSAPRRVDQQRSTSPALS
jgi:diguanylate cyclase (GGDEF)-like protein